MNEAARNFDRLKNEQPKIRANPVTCETLLNKELPYVQVKYAGALVLDATAKRRPRHGVKPILQRFRGRKQAYGQALACTTVRAADSA